MDWIEQLRIGGKRTGMARKKRMERKWTEADRIGWKEIKRKEEGRTEVAGLERTGPNRKEGA